VFEWSCAGWHARPRTHVEGSPRDGYVDFLAVKPVSLEIRFALP